MKRLERPLEGFLPCMGHAAGLAHEAGSGSNRKHPREDHRDISAHE